MSTEGRSAHCSVCGEVEIGAAWPVRGFYYRRCSACGSAQLDPLPAISAAEYYDDDYFVGNRVGGYDDYEADASNHRRNGQSRLDRIAGCLPSGQIRLIDIGCAAGYVLEEARGRGWTASGVDISAWGRRMSASKQFEAVATFEEVIATNRPNVVTLYQVLEHMPDAMRQLDAICAALPADGVLAIETWDVSSLCARIFGSHWQQMSPPSVIFLFSRIGLTRSLQRRDMEVLSIRSTSKRVSLQLVLGVIGQRFALVERLCRRLARSPVGQIGMMYRLGDLITVVARKQ